MMKRVLIIDDEVDLCVLIKKYLNKKHHEVYIAHSLSDGLLQLHALQPDSLLLDNNLPDGMGWKSVESIHSNFPTMKILLISAFKSTESEEVAFIKYGIHVSEKPLSLKEIEQNL